MADVMDPRTEERQQNKRTALVLASIALVFFLGVIAKYWLLR